MVSPPPDLSRFEFVVLAGLRALQLSRGCVPRLAGTHVVAVMAQMEVAAREVRGISREHANGDALDSAFASAEQARDRAGNDAPRSPDE